MLSYLRNLTAQASAPIGIDCGSRLIKAVQVLPGKGGFSVGAAASAAVPETALNEAAELARFFRGTVRPMLSSGGFGGRRVALAVPVHCMHLASFRRTRSEFAAGAWEYEPSDAAIRGWLPFPESHALIRNIDAGEVYHEDGPRREVVSLAVRRDVVARYTAAAAAAGLEVTGVASEPEALLAALALSGADSRLMRLVVDLGLSGTRVYAAIGRQLLFARRLRTSGAHLEHAVATSLGVGREASCALRCDLPSLDSGETVGDVRLREVDEACGQHIEQLVTELRHCHQYVSSVFSATPVHHIVFAGGGAKHRRLWQRIASGVGLPARAADPLSRMSRPRPNATGAMGVPAGAGWAVAAGLSVGAAPAHGKRDPNGPAGAVFEDHAIGRFTVAV